MLHVSVPSVSLRFNDLVSGRRPGCVSSVFSVCAAVTDRLAVCATLIFFGLGTSAFGQGYAPQDAVGKMTLPPGLAATLFASEPEVRQPIFCKCDDRGRLWTIQYLQYPNP